MDKRWIGIIIILIAGLGCMYLIANNSITVGSAVTVINDVTISIPPEFISSEDGTNFSVLFNKQTNETARIRCLDNGNNHVAKYNEKLKSLKSDGNIIVKKHSSNDNYSMIDYENMSSTDKKYITMAYYDKCNHTFSVQMEHFADNGNKEKLIDYLIENSVFDFKQKKLV